MCRLDVHADFCVPLGSSQLDTIASVTHDYGLEGRVTLGHCTTLARMAPADRGAALEKLAAARIDLIVLPRTDLYLDGAIAPLGELRWAGVRGLHRQQQHLQPVYARRPAVAALGCGAVRPREPRGVALAAR